MGFSAAQAKRLVAEAKKDLGPGWGVLGEALQEALLCQKVLYLALAQDSGQVSVADLDKLLAAVLVESKAK